ncbi:hypothetical protein PC129_g11608 [Phytophthora cactorum]|uniref:Uncharacterized protein n=1 Tax=Phytophthora cactorum TaxID=29920 RepID=A0A329S569_9STRA|nr:hypothetical protein Pcac1_g18295 [Phytophthora cactorum]KAG2820137.1 hypothetical protein PC111_g11597 [Phytophthora cactorum]KAG2844202.1 hypothetical protein PC112_g2278 [Phytophthora cactorum]KAG2854881.1 hypothetical protein PC113_g12928 [Phytophthora cactorum]KAG2899633.1 hypothetical protein PC114_g13858 [Phytophthora cactorum]
MSSPPDAPDQDQTSRNTASNTKQTFRVKKSRLKKDGTPYKSRKGWGPYRSVPNERSVAFNLQLDVQNLQQEVSNLLVLREILQTKTLVQRHTPEGSLTRLVNEYLYVFRKGVVPQQPGRGRIVENRDQRAFMHSVMDPDVELGPGLPRGPDVIMDQMVNYTNFLRFISLKGVVDSIVVAEDSVLVSDAACFLFQVTRSTIEMIFPHIMGNEWLVAMLVGQEVATEARSTFHFNPAGKCYRYDVEMDFVGAFLDIVKNPLIVDMLLGRALISYNGMFRVANEGSEPEDEEKAPVPLQDNAHSDTTEGSLGVTAESSSPSPSFEFCRRIVDDYFAAFATGYEQETTKTSGASQRDFFLYRFGSQQAGTVTKVADQVRERWCALRETFEVLSFQQKGPSQTELDDTSSSCLVVSSATYVLRITFHTIESVFPHLLSDTQLFDTLVGKVLMVPSQIFFSIEKTSGYISRISERMDFATAMADVVPGPRDLARILSQAKLAPDGVDFHQTSSITPGRSHDQTQRGNLERLQKDMNAGSSSRTMRITDILE